ncbi:hypothetical protein B9Q02_11205 [Candidatus Marsarchaeota G1 archaeon BE_D]|uniref:CRISPR type III-associated protein domain-containing protein n=1 Tax=Candidatus Marsarchaeota G1 archaeon BE_D TaxID=1978156 RepID=A0A2R6A8V1_9ARCH|nr:MAG: hypothetical protein B9Q02_11205 [Candidatus Marsarchaeota G1 archaeon BE_D]
MIDLEKYTNHLFVESLRANTESPSFSLIKEDFEIDLRSLIIDVNDAQNRHTLVIPGSSIRGVVRRWAERYDKALVEELFGNDIISGSEPKAGKLIFSFARAEDLTNKTHNKRYGIKINQLGTVEANALYSYEFLRGEKPIRITFDSIALVPLKDDEKELLAKSIASLKYSSIGWGNSRGLGLIKEVELDARLQKYLHV